MVSMEALRAIVEASVQAALAGQRAATSGGGGSNRLDERHFRRVDKLEGSNWKEFAFQFKTAVGTLNPAMREHLDEIQKAGQDPDFDTIFVEDEQEEIDRAGAELYGHLASLVTGEAMMVLRGVPNGRGREAWSKLFNRLDPRTPAKMLMCMMVVMTPKKVKDVRELAHAVEEWEVKAKQLKMEHHRRITSP